MKEKLIESKNEVSLRIKKILKKTNLSQSKLARKLDVDAPSVNKFTKGQRITTTNIIRFKNALNISADWLLYGIGEMTLDNKKQPNENIVKIESYEFAAGSAGDGAFIDDAGEKIYYNFPLKLLWDLDISQKKVQKIKAFKVVGDSMEPELFNRDYAFLDISENTIKAGGIYLIRQDNEHYIKKASRIDEYRLELIPSNKNYSTTILDSRHGDITIIGRIIASIKVF